jgi:DNA-binding transcriptional ArsR family regulator
MKTVTNLNRPALVRALAHPLRARILGILQERTASPSELSDELGAPLGNVSYHVRVLSDLKLIKLTKKTPRRGAIEHHYEAVSMAQITDEAWSQTTSVVKHAMVTSALQEIGRSVGQAAGLGGFERTDAHLTRTRLTLDEKGWNELSVALAKLTTKAEQLQEQSAKRLAKADHEGELNTTVVFMQFEEPSAISAKDTGQAPAARKPQRKRSRSRATMASS